MFCTKTCKPELDKNKKATKYIFHAYFHNRGLDFMHTTKDLKNDDVILKLPNIFQNDKTSSVVYSW